MGLLQSFGGSKIVVSEIVLVISTVRELEVGNAESEDDIIIVVEATGKPLRPCITQTEQKWNMYSAIRNCQKIKQDSTLKTWHTLTGL